MKLGTFGAAIRELDPDSERDTFDFFGEEFTVEGAIPPILMLQLGAYMVGKAGRMEGNAAMWTALHCALSSPGRDGGESTEADAAQFDRFYRLAVAKKCDMDELISLVFTLVGVQAGKAEEQLPTSQDGSQPASTTSNSSASDTPDSPALRSVDEVLNG